MGRRVSTSGRLLFVVLMSRLLFGQMTDEPKSSTSLELIGLRKYVRERMAVGQIPSIGISVTRGHEILWEEGFGTADRENGFSATPHTSFYLASVTKAITGTAVMVLKDRGRIDLDQSVNEYLGAAKVHSPMWNPENATVRRVATHTAGLTTYNRKCPLRGTGCKVSIAAAIERYGILFWPPGEHFDYSNLGYGVLGEVVSRVSKKKYPDFLRDEIFGPLGMLGCFIGPRSGTGSEVAAQYDSSSRTRTAEEVSDTPGASSAHCSVHDLALLGMFALGEHLPNQRRILSDAALYVMLHPTVESGDGERYGFGWSLQPDYHGYVGVYAQGGTNDSFAVLQMIPSEKVAVSVIANTGTIVPFDIVDQVLRSLLPHFRETEDGEKVTQPEQHKESVTKIPLVGNWVGVLHTWKGDVPIAIEIISSHEVRAKWQRGSWIKASDVAIADPRFYCVIANQIETPDAPQTPPRIELELYLRGTRLVGAATTKDGMQLPYWVQLQKSHFKVGATVGQ